MAVDKLVDSTQLDTDLTSVANAIRAKSGGSSQLAFPSGFVSEIQAIPSGSSVHAIIGTSTSSGYYMVIPKEDGYNNFFAYVSDADASYFSGGGGRAICCYRLSWMSTSVYSMKAINNNNFPPPAVSGGVHSAIFVEETSSSVKVKFPNGNTVGALPDGQTITYILW